MNPCVGLVSAGEEKSPLPNGQFQCPVSVESLLD
jgi:hypothetical protein